MAFAPVGPEASFFEVLERHRASLLAAQRGRGDPPDAGIRLASSPQVLAAIENIVADVVRSLARREAPALALEDRASWQNMRFAESVGLQMAPHCTTRRVRSDSLRSAQKFALILKILSMIYKLVQSNTYATKRDIYYMDSQLFGSQTVVDSIIDDISCMLKVPRRSLHISSTSKGLIAGNLSYLEEDGTRVSCTCGATVVAVPSNIQGIRNAKFLLIVEKDATFQRLLDDNFCSRMSPCIMVTYQRPYSAHAGALCRALYGLLSDPVLFHISVLRGSAHPADQKPGSYRQRTPQGKGVPDLNTRLLVKKLWDTFHIPAFTLVDADPHGIEIMCIYKYGSMSMSFEAHHLTVPAIRWLGLLPSDVKRLNVPKDSLIPLTRRDLMKLDSIRKRPYIACQPLWRAEMEAMASSNVKAGIQALTFLSADYLSRVYLPNKLRSGGWI